MPASQTPYRVPRLRRRRYRRFDAKTAFRSLYPGRRSDYRHVRRIRPRLTDDRDFNQRTESGMRLIFVYGLTILFCLVAWSQALKFAARLWQ